MKAGFVYIMASRKNGTIYTGVTSELPGRVHAHREGLIDGFTKRYGCKLLVWFEMHDDLQDARQRERQIKEWKRGWKIRLIEEQNPDWLDLFFDTGLIPAGAGPGPRPSPGHKRYDG